MIARNQSPGFRDLSGFIPDCRQLATLQPAELPSDRRYEKFASAAMVYHAYLAMPKPCNIWTSAALAAIHR